MELHTTLQYKNLGSDAIVFGQRARFLLASSATNFIYKINNLNKSYLDEINAIDTSTKLKDRINKIYELGGSFEYIGAEKDLMDFNLKMVDSDMPALVGKILLYFYKDRIASIKEITQKIAAETNDKNTELLLINKIKKLLIDAMLGFFPGSQWDGKYSANGAIMIKKDGSQVGFHIIEIDTLKNYLFENVRLETPATKRHKYGKLYMEKGGNLYFKLNLQLRF